MPQGEGIFYRFPKDFYRQVFRGFTLSKLNPLMGLVLRLSFREDYRNSKYQQGVFPWTL